MSGAVVAGVRSERRGDTPYTESNSSLLSIAGLNNYIITGGTAFDEDGQLWVVAGGNTTP